MLNPALLKRLKTFEKIREVWISNDFLNFVYHISIVFWIRNTFLQKFLQTDMIFSDQFKVHTVKFGKFAKFITHQEHLTSVFSVVSYTIRSVIIYCIYAQRHDSWLFSFKLYRQRRRSSKNRLVRLDL